MSTPATDAENQLKKVRKLEANRTCPNCGSSAPTLLGFSNICVKFKTFICDNCKTSHQAISHRCKSVSMSSWTMDEVRALMDAQGGGNAYALNTYLANAPPVGGKYPGGSRPQKGDKIEVFKQFILDCYEMEKFKGGSGFTYTAQAEVAPPSSPVKANTSQSSRIAAPQAPPAVVFDFFSEESTKSNNTDFSQFENSPNPNNNGFDFNQFEVSSTTASVGSNTTSNLNTFDASPSTSTNNFDPFGTNDVLQPSFTSSQSEGNLAGLSISSSAAPIAPMGGGYSVGNSPMGLSTMGNTGMGHSRSMGGGMNNMGGGMNNMGGGMNRPMQGGSPMNRPMQGGSPMNRPMQGGSPMNRPMQGGSPMSGGMQGGRPMSGGIGMGGGRPMNSSGGLPDMSSFGISTMNSQPPSGRNEDKFGFVQSSMSSQLKSPAAPPLRGNAMPMNAYSNQQQQNRNNTQQPSDMSFPSGW